jgi:hypothetical protein
LGTYLDEIAARGYAKQIRIIYTPYWGPRILRDWIPTIREKGFKVLVILSQDGRGGKYGDDSVLTEQADWIARGLPPIADLLISVQPANEPDGFSGKTPQAFAEWYRQMVPLIRAAVPGIPILSPDLRGVGAWNAWTKKTGLKYGVDFDVVSLHVTHVDRVGDLKAYRADVRTFTGANSPRIITTEGDWGQTAWFNTNGLPIEHTFVYVWNGHEPESRRPEGVIPCGP